MKMKNVLLLAILLYIVSTGAAYATFSAIGSSKKADDAQNQQKSDMQADQQAQESEGLAIDPNEAKDQVCPLDGQMYTKTEKDVWSTRRPLAVMIENHPEARPQSGLIRADIVFEALAEGGVTRFMGMFYCDVVRNDVTLAPVRSARDNYIDWASGFNRPLYVHVGGANLPGPVNALGHLGDYGWNGENDINQFSVGYPTFVRNYNRIAGKDIATEHTMVSTSEKLWDVGVKREWTNLDPKGNDWSAGYKGWTFADAEEPGKGSVNTLSYEFWTGDSDYSVKWDYDKATNSYLRTMAGEPHKDLETGKQLAVKSVIVMNMKSKVVDELKHMLYNTTGTGTAVLFQNGEAIELNWSKPKRESELAFTDKKGKPVELVRGKMWISVVDNTAGKVTY
ncbi:MAG: DUF3048 domain-containing protein [Patescibacteria group bacterium]